MKLLATLLACLPPHLCHRCAYATLAGVYAGASLDLLHGGAVYGGAVIAYAVLALR